MRYLLISAIWLLACNNHPANYQIDLIRQDSGTTASLRGLDVVDAKTAWASGAKGTVLRTTDGGVTWQDVSIPAADSLDFRDIEAFSATEAVIMNAGFPGVICKTDDGGKNWELVYQDLRPQIFFDAMDFWDENSGIAFGDAIDGHIVIITTIDGGASWQQLAPEMSPAALQGEGGFAASGTCITTFGDSSVWIALGTPKSRVLHSANRGNSWQVINTPMAQAAAGAGIFSLEFSSARYGIAIGGNYQLPNDTTKVISLTHDGGKSWKLLSGSGLNGFKSAITNIPTSNNWLCAGTSGVNFSSDNGNTWNLVDSTGYHTIRMADNNLGWLSGGNGRIAKIVIRH